MAKKYLINGWVLNATDGVHIHAEGESALVDEFIMELSDNPPAASRVEEIDIKEVPWRISTASRFRFSDDEDVAETTLVSPELATCEDCVRELFNPNDRAGRASPSSTSFPYDRVAKRPWWAFPCAKRATPNIVTRPTDVSTHSPTHASNAALVSGGKRALEKPRDERSL